MTNPVNAKETKQPLNQPKYKKKMKRTAFVSIRVTAEEKKKLTQSAKRENKTLTDYVLGRIKHNPFPTLDMNTWQDLGATLYQARESMNNSVIPSPELEEAITQTINFFFHKERKSS